MSRTAADRIADIRAAVARFLRYADDLDAAEGHLADMAADAIERNIAVIGEAANNLPETMPANRSLGGWRLPSTRSD